MRIQIVLFLIIYFVAAPAAGKEIAGVALADAVTQNNGTELRLNGAGIRSKFFFKVYIGALYLESVSQEADTVINSDTGKQLLMHFLYKEVSKDDLVEAWNVGFDKNGSTEQLTGLSTQIADFNAMFETVKSGDRIVLDYAPEGGTSVSIRGELKGVIKGKAFNDLLLSIWLGTSPVDEDLRDDLLGK
jgi:hypothetical protein